jgi:hypothetical protein
MSSYSLFYYVGDNDTLGSLKNYQYIDSKKFKDSVGDRLKKDSIEKICASLGTLAIDLFLKMWFSFLDELAVHALKGQSVASFESQLHTHLASVRDQSKVTYLDQNVGEARKLTTRTVLEFLRSALQVHQADKAQVRVGDVQAQLDRLDRAFEAMGDMTEMAPYRPAERVTATPVQRTAPVGQQQPRQQPLVKQPTQPSPPSQPTPSMQPNPQDRTVNPARARIVIPQQQQQHIERENTSKQQQQTGQPPQQSQPTQVLPEKRHESPTRRAQASSPHPHKPLKEPNASAGSNPPQARIVITQQMQAQSQATPQKQPSPQSQPQQQQLNAQPQAPNLSRPQGEPDEYFLTFDNKKFLATNVTPPSSPRESEQSLRIAARESSRFVNALEKDLEKESQKQKQPPPSPGRMRRFDENTNEFELQFSSLLSHLENEISQEVKNKKEIFNNRFLTLKYQNGDNSTAGETFSNYLDQLEQDLDDSSLNSYEIYLRFFLSF